jgi:hypothetical protein
MRKISTKQIGDGKLPNKYWVSISEDFLYYDNYQGAFTWDSDRNPEANPKCRTIRVFKTYREARAFLDSLPMGGYYDGILVNGAEIEDRITGEVANRVLRETERTIKDYEFTDSEDLMFTKERISKEGGRFE